MKTFLLKSGFLTIVFFIANLFFTSAAFGQTVTLDQADLDYAPGETVYITGTGWQPNEVINLQVDHLTVPIPDHGTPNPHLPWTVLADSSGNFDASWFVTDYELGSELLLIADGVESGFTYKVFFTDAPTVTSVVANTGATTGGANVTINGTGFVSNGTITVSFGGTAATNVVRTSNSVLTCTSPAHVSGSVTVSVTVTGSGGGNNGTGNLNNGFTYNKVNQTITFANPGTKTYGNADFNLGASATSSLTVNYTIVSGSATIVSGNMLHITGAGSVTVRASQSGDGNYNAATNVDQTFTVNKANQTITVDTASPASATYNTGFTVAATASSGLEVAYTSAAPLSNVDANYTMNSGTGTGVVKYNQAGNVNYNAAPEVTVNVAATKANQTITVDTASPTSATYNTSFIVAATASSGLAVAYTSVAPLSNVGANYTMNSGTGAGVVKYNQTGNVNYNAAPEVTVNVAATKANQTITWETPSNITYGTLLGSTELDASVAGSSTAGASAPGALTYTPVANALLAAGSHTLSVSAAATDDYNGASATVTLVVDKAEQTITWSNPSNITYGTLLGSTELDVSVAGSSTAGASAPGALTYTPAAGTLLGAGSHTLSVSAAATDDYNAASATVTLVVDKAEATLTFGNLGPHIYTGSEFAATASTSPSGLAGVTVTGAGTDVGSYAATASLDNPNYWATPINGSLVIDKAEATLTFGNLGPHIYTGIEFAATASTSPSGLAGVTVTGAGTNVGSYAATASLDNPNYWATPINGSLVIDKAEATLTFGNLGPHIYTGSEFAATASTSPSGLAGVTVTGAGTNVGSYAATASLDNPNYWATPINGSLVIDKAEATITVAPYSVTYDGNVHTATFTAVGVETIPVDLTALMNVSGTTHTNAATYNGDAWSFAGNNNYAATSGTVNNAINKRPITITADPKHKFSGQVDPPLTYQISDVLASTLTASVSSYPFTGNLSRNPGENSGNHTIIQGTVSLNSNYELTYVPSNLTINCVTIDASASSTPVQLNSPAILKATVTPSSVVPGLSLANIPVLFTLNNGNGGVTTYNALTDPTGFATTTTSVLPVEVYLITATAGTGCNNTSTAYLPVYDPNGGFVTGGGWINSPEGALIGSTLKGKANFGFVAKYKKGNNEVDGNTEFQFQTGNLNFKSSSHEAMSLVIAGAQATYKGKGTINGISGYSFMVSAIDGDKKSTGVTDKFRIKIWNASGVVYDNQKLSPDNAEASTALGGGSIVIHEAKKNTTAKVVIVEKTPEIVPFAITAYPNPSTQYFIIDIKGGTNEKTEVIVYDILGRIVKHIDNDNNQEIKFGEELPSGSYIAIINQGVKQKTVRLVKK